MGRWLARIYTIFPRAPPLGANLCVPLGVGDKPLHNGARPVEINNLDAPRCMGWEAARVPTIMGGVPHP